MNLTDEQKARVAAWADEGASLNDLQKRLKEELGVTITYLETRFLIADLGITIRDSKAAEREKEKEKESVQAGAAKAEVAGQRRGGGVLDGGDENFGSADRQTGEGAFPGGVDVVVDSIAVPGSIVSGSVTFSDGKRAAWYLDQMGRLGLNPPEPGYQPSQSDLMTFQTKLEEALRRQGF